MFYGLFEFEGLDVEQDIIPYVGQLELSNVSVKGWITDLYVHGLLDGHLHIDHLSSAKLITIY